MFSQLQQKWLAIKLITRMDKPIGTYLLLWPTYWALWIGSDGWPSFHLLIVFSLGVFVMRSAGCVINDIADIEIDGKVERTKNRPLISGLMTKEQAINLFGVLIGSALGLVMTLSWNTIYLSFVALVLASLYPFMKRYTQLPQVVLGAAFSWGIIMAFSETMGQIPLVAWLLFVANILWTVAYDTIYAMVDKEDDLKIGVKSTAILFGDKDQIVIGFIQLTVVGLLFKVGDILAFGWPYQLSIFSCAVLFCYQQLLIRQRKRDKYFQAFLHNHWVGMVVFIGILIEYL
jgi:4-hydroxybenzoate polyprenyltransferase